MIRGVGGWVGIDERLHLYTPIIKKRKCEAAKGENVS